MKYGIFWGCAVPSRLPFIEKATGTVLSALGIDAAPIADATCCMDPIVLKSLSTGAWLGAAARNLALAKAQGFDAVLTLCNGCFCSLNETADFLEEDPELRERVNRSLGTIGRTYPGGMKVRHLTQLLDEVPAEAIARLAVKPLGGRKVATFHGCHLVRPSKHARIDDPVRPRILDRLVDRLGGEPVEYSERNECCGMGFAGSGEWAGADRLSPILRKMEESGAEWIVTPCPSCFLQLEGAQRAAALPRPLPVLHVAEMFARAFGADDAALGMRYHRVQFAAREGVSV
jgi:heterodisulfide reductase subunit B